MRNQCGEERGDCELHLPWHLGLRRPWPRWHDLDQGTAVGSVDSWRV